MKNPNFPFLPAAVDENGYFKANGKRYSFPIFPPLVFVGHPDKFNDEGFIMKKQDFENIIDELHEHYQELYNSPEMKYDIYYILKRYKDSDISKNDWNKLILHKPAEAIY